MATASVAGLPADDIARFMALYGRPTVVSGPSAERSPVEGEALFEVRGLDGQLVWIALEITPEGARRLREDFPGGSKGVGLARSAAGGIKAALRFANTYLPASARKGLVGLIPRADFPPPAAGTGSGVAKLKAETGR